MLTNQEQLKYSRQIMLDKIGISGQLALRNSKVLIIGLGGLGNPVSLYLAAAGVGNLFLMDGDTIEISNLPRQVMFHEEDITKNKAETLTKRLQKQFPDSNIEAIDDMLDQELCNYYFPQVDVVLDCSDNRVTRYLINRACIEYKIPLVIGSATAFDGQQLIVDSRNTNNACYQCLYPENEMAPINNCKTVGILGPVLGIIAGMQSLQTIKLLTGNEVQTNQLNVFDGLLNQWQQFKIKKRSGCKACNEG